MFALTLPDSFRLRLNLRSGFVLDILERVGPPDGAARRREAGACCATRRVGPRWTGWRRRPRARLRAIANWARVRPARDLRPTSTGGSRAGSSATSRPSSGGRRGTRWPTSSWPTSLRTVIANQDKGQDEASWARRVEVWRDGRAIVGASDAGAHLDMIDSLLVLDHAARPHRSGAGPAADGGGHPLPDRQPGRAVRAAGPRPAGRRRPRRRRRPRPRRRSGRARCTPASTCRAARAASTARPRASPTSSSTGSPAVEGGDVLDARPGALLRSGRDTDTRHRGLRGGPR